MLTGSEGLLNALGDKRARSLAVTHTFREREFTVPQIAIANPTLWELGHVAWFDEYWILRRLNGAPPLRADGDALYDSAAVAHATRWGLPLPSYEETVRYGEAVLERIAGVIERPPLDAPTRYFSSLAIFHEDMHAEAGLMTAQTLHYRWPLPVERTPAEEGPLTGDAEIPGGRYRVGAEPGSGFVFDNEKWAHDVEVATFRIARAPVTNAEYAAFLEATGAAPPRDWVRATDGRWLRWRFDELVPVRPHAPVCNVSRVDAEAFCRAAGRRLPTEAEWEIAATADPKTGERQNFPWGDDAPSPRLANLDAQMREPLDVAALPAGDSPAGLRQTIGNVWEWTASPFLPYPGFLCDPYAEYSAPWFGDHAVLRGGAWTTRSRLIRGTWRNFYRPDRSDPFAGFRTCALILN